MIWAIFTSVVFACSNLFIRFYLANTHWLSLIWWRSLASSFILVIMVFSWYSHHEIEAFIAQMILQKRLWSFTLITGFIGILGFIKAIKSLPLYAVIPFTTLNLVALGVSHFYLTIPVTWQQLVGIVTGMVGFSLIYQNQHSIQNRSGWAWLLITVVCWGISYPLSQPLIRSSSPLFFATSMEVVIAIGSTILFIAGKPDWKNNIQYSRPKPAQYIILVTLLVLGVLGNGFARYGVSPIAMLAFSGFSEIGLLTASHFLFNESMKPIHWTGALLTILAMFLVF